MDARLLEIAGRRLIDDPALPDRLVAEIKRSAGMARQNHPRGFAALDGDLARDLRAAGELRGGEQLLKLEALAGSWASLLAEATAAVEERAARERAAAHEARTAPMRERARADNAAATARPVLTGLADFQAVADDAKRALHARDWHDEGSLVAALDALSDGITALRTSIAATRRESQKRTDAAEAARVIDRISEIARAA